MATTTLKVDGVAYSFPANNTWAARMILRLVGVSTLTLAREGGPLPGLPDPLVGSEVELAIDGTTYFKGDVVGVTPRFDKVGWSIAWQCQDLRARADRVAFTDDNTRSDVAVWNLPSDDPLWLAARAGRTVGQIVADALTMQDNADAFAAHGIGAYTSLSPPTLPAATLADLAALTLIPPAAVQIGGEKAFGAIEGFLQEWAPNHAPRIEPDGTIRVLDRRTFTERVFVIGDCDDRVEPSPLSRYVDDCFQRVVYRGRTTAEPKMLTEQSGGIVENFAWGVFDNAGAKADWTPADFDEDKQARSQGTCTCTDTLNVVLTSDPASDEWGVNDWDQTHRMGVLHLWSTVASGVDQFVTRRVVANASKSSGGTSSFTLDMALPATNYDRYMLYGVSSGSSFVWRRYSIADPDIAAALARQFTYPVPWIGANGDVATLTSFPMGSVCWSASGDPPYNEVPIPISFDTASGDIIFGEPTYRIPEGRPPDDVRVLLAVNTGTLTAVAPASGYEGTSHTVEGLEETLVVTSSSWRDPVNQANMVAKAQDLLDSVKDTVVEGEVRCQTLITEALTFGLGASVTGAGYTTGWEGLNLPIVEVELSWNSGTASMYTTTMRCSNRRAQMTDAAFERPERRTDFAIGDPTSQARGNIGQWSPEGYARRARGEDADA